MLKKLLTSAVFAGFGAGLIAAALQITLLVPLLIEAEEYESGDKVYFETALHEPSESEHGHDDAADNPSHAEASAWERNSQTVLWTLGTYLGFALVLAACFGTAERFGIEITARSGILWGLAGFVAIHLSPAAGNAPELPGAWAADLFERQRWWAGTAIATAAGLAAIAFGKNWMFWAVGIALLAAPHVIGAPQPEEFGGVVPPELAAHFVSLSLAVGAIGWACLGMFAGYFWQRSPA